MICLLSARVTQQINSDLACSADTTTDNKGNSFVYKVCPLSSATFINMLNELHHWRQNKTLELIIDAANHYRITRDR